MSDFFSTNNDNKNKIPMIPPTTQRNLNMNQNQDQMQNQFTPQYFNQFPNNSNSLQQNQNIQQFQSQMI